MGDFDTVSVKIHYGGSMNKEDDDYKYVDALDCKSLNWKYADFTWKKIEDFLRFEIITAPIGLVWYKSRSKEMKDVNYVIDCDSLYEMYKLAQSEGGIDLFIEHVCLEHIPGDSQFYMIGGNDGTDGEEEKDQEVGNDGGENRDDGYEGGYEDSEQSDSSDDEKVDRPREDEEVEESDDEITRGHKEVKETVATERDEFVNDGRVEPLVDEGVKPMVGVRVETEISESVKPVANKRVETVVDEGDDVVAEAGNGSNDYRFESLFEEGTKTILDKQAYTDLEEKAAAVREAEESEEEEKEYPYTPLESEEEWDQWYAKPRAKCKGKFHGEFDKEPYIWLFQKFNSGLEFKDQLLRYALKTQYDVKMAKSEANRIAVICCKEKCLFRVLCSYEKPINRWMVKVCHMNHNHGKSSRVSMVKQGVIAGLFREELRRNVSLQAAEIKDTIKARYNIVVPISKCYRGRRIALDSILEAQSTQFGKLWQYEAELRRTHPRIHTEICTVELNGGLMFDCMYICFEEFRTTWKNCCRPVIGIDGCFLKWELNGDLLAAVGRDADNRMYPIAWAVVRGENQDTWGWFLKKLKSDLSLGTGEKLTVISDKQKGLVIAMANELPQAEHRMCARHIYANWKKKGFSRSEYKNLFWGVAYSYTEGECEEKLGMVNAFDPAAHAALLETDPERWCRAYFNNQSHCADVHNNLSESFNRTIKMARTKPVINLLEDIRRQAMRRVSRRFLKAEKCNTVVTPITMALLEKARRNNKYCSTIRSSSSLYEVDEFDCGYSVNLSTHECACRKWDLTGIPCKHAVCVLDDNQEDPVKYVAEYYYTHVFKATYADNIKPVNGQSMWRKVNKPPIGIPEMRKPRGRPKNRDRIKEPFEDLSNPGKSTRHGRIPHCSRCKEAGHIKTSCKNEIVEVEGPKNRRGRPSKLPSEIQLVRPPKPRRKRQASTVGTSSQPSVMEPRTTSSQPAQASEGSSQTPVTSSAPQPTASTSHPKPHLKKTSRGRPLKIRKTANIPIGVGTMWSPFLDRPFEVFGNRIYDRSGLNPQPPVANNLHPPQADDTQPPP